MSATARQRRVGKGAARSLRMGIVLSGVAPAMTLMAGVMRAFARLGFEFEVISTSGAGGLIGLLYLAPKGGRTPEQALGALPNLFVSDALYKFLPFNFKVFGKHGPFAAPMRELGKRIKPFELDPGDRARGRRLVNDGIDLALCALTPTTYGFASKGLMTHLPWAEELVDFDRLRRSRTVFYLNAFDCSSQTLKIFDQSDLDLTRYNAAQSMLFLFPPERMGTEVLSLGATHDPTGLQALWRRHKRELDMIIALDPISPAFRREPKNIYDAFQLMLMNPVATLQQHMLSLYAETEYLVNRRQQAGRSLPRLYRIPFDDRLTEQYIAPEYYPELLSWSYSNAVTLQSKGEAAAQDFADVLQSGDDGELEQRFRFYHFTEGHDSLRAMMRDLAPAAS